MASSYIILLFRLLNLILTASQDEKRIDSWFVKVLGHPKLFKVTKKNREFWLPVIEKVVLNLSDQQILAGLSIFYYGVPNALLNISISFCLGGQSCMDVFKCSFSDTWHSQKLLEGKAYPARLAGLFNVMH